MSSWKILYCVVFAAAFVLFVSGFVFNSSLAYAYGLLFLFSAAPLGMIQLMAWWFGEKE